MPTTLLDDAHLGSESNALSIRSHILTLSVFIDGLRLVLDLTALDLKSVSLLVGHLCELTVDLVTLFLGVGCRLFMSSRFLCLEKAPEFSLSGADG